MGPTFTGADAARQFLRAFCGDGSVTLDRLGRLATLTLSNPAQGNAVTPAMMCELSDCLDELERFNPSLAKWNAHRTRSDDVVGLVLRGDEGTFCDGVSRDVVESAASARELRELGACMRELMTDNARRLAELPFPTAALVEGSALGGGAELAASTDFRIWAPSARMCYTHARLGLTPGWGGASRLVELVGRRQALYLLSSSRAVEAPLALQIGLADAVAAGDGAGDVEAAANTFFAGVTEQPHSRVVRAIKHICSSPGAADGSGKRSAAAGEHPRAALKTMADVERDTFLELWPGDAAGHDAHSRS